MSGISISVVRSNSTDEPMGTKPKFWFKDEDGQRWLFKFARPNTGEDWSEKVAAGVGRMLGVPCAHVELAVCGGRAGSVSRDFLLPGQTLIHGNELLHAADETYPHSKDYRADAHTVCTV